MSNIYSVGDCDCPHQLVKHLVRMINILCLSNHVMLNLFCLKNLYQVCSATVSVHQKMHSVISFKFGLNSFNLKQCLMSDDHLSMNSSQCVMCSLYLTFGQTIFNKPGFPIGHFYYAFILKIIHSWFLKIVVSNPLGHLLWNILVLK